MMSRRGAALPSAEERTLTSLRNLAARSGNAGCLECSQRGPTYVDVTLGSFVCSRCSGLLRGLTPPHRVKSISMATFTVDELNFIKNRGNDYCRSIWMALYEGEQPPLKDEQSLRDFMSDKYEKKRYYLDTNANSNERLKVTKEPAIIIPPPSTKDNGFWSSSTSRPVGKLTNSIPHAVPPVNVVLPSTHITNNTFNEQSSNVPRFPVDFNNADIFNSSQLNNNLTSSPPPPSQSSFANFDMKNVNVVSQDRYAALADLDLTLRQQNQSQTKEDVTKSAPNFNPFEGTSYSNNPRNPFWTNSTNVNGNAVNYSNPFIVGPSLAPSGQSNNPFL